ncbi:MAG: DUF692 family multinuclear iron-containing protein [Candidatus Methylacidiphilales bacterium]|nr:DUF692 domain-containing protein [Candidatus Methylacidiphilales bacterium]
MKSLKPTGVIHTGVGYRGALGSWIKTKPKDVTCLEITAEHFFDHNEHRLAWLAREFELYVHGLGLSLGTPGPMDLETLRRFQRVAEIAKPQWVSEHIAFTRTAGMDLGHLNPVPPTRAMAEIVAAHARRVADACQRPIILENITSHVQLPGDMAEPDFLNEICEFGDCGLLLDVTNLFINSRNHCFDPIEWLNRINPDTIVQLHIVGYSKDAEGRLADDHAKAVQPEILELAQEVVNYAMGLRAIILERDMEIPEAREMDAEISALRRLVHERFLADG